jgi:putative sigma-54 modulation protein
MMTNRRTTAKEATVQIDVLCRPFSLKPEHSDWVRQRVAAALKTADHRVVRANVRIADINGTRGGVDKSCLITATLKGMQPAIAEARATDIDAAVDLAAQRLRHGLRTRLGRRRTLRRHSANGADLK